MMFRKLSFAILFFFTSYSAFSAKHFQEFNPNLYEKIDGKYAMKNQLLVAYQSSSESTAFISQLTRSLKNKGLTITAIEAISSKSAKLKIVKLKLQNQQLLTSLRTSARTIPNLKWVQPNYVYNIGMDPREETPNDPHIQDQYHHRLMNNLRAWDISIGKNIILAVTDDGFDINHEDLVSQFYPGKGYNFCDNNTDVSVHDYDSEHGTHVVGIAAAELNNGKGGAGVAGGATILPVKFYGRSCNWTSELVYKSYQYAADNGAKIITTSYNIDGFVDDQTFIAGLDYAYDKGVLHFNSAGNNDKKNPPRQAFEELILVASINKNDIKSSDSNYGTGIQISAPGEDIFSTIPGNQYQLMSGTSTAAPNAAASAALIWSAHPTWNRNQVAAQLIGTTDNIDDKNPEYKGLLGSGRINNYRALTEKVAPAKITEVNVTTSSQNTMLAIHFDKLLDPNVVNNGKHWEIKSLSDNSIIPATLEHSWLIGSTTLKLVLPILSNGKYQLTVKDSLKDPFSQAIDGNADGNAGGNFVYEFEIKYSSSI